MAGAIVFELSGDGRKLRETTRRAEKDLGGLAGAAQKMQKNWLAAGAAIGGATIVISKATQVIGSAIGSASDYAEAASKVSVVFGESEGVIRSWAQGSATSMGLAEGAALTAAGTFGNLFTAMGLGQGAAADLSVDVTQLAVDLASFNNIDTESALEKLRAGLVGEAEPLRQLGININAASVANEAMRLGLAKTKAELDDSAKIMARWSLITGQSASATGDFARTSDGLANSSKILDAKVEDLRRRLGEAFLPAAEAVTSELIKMLDIAEKLGAIDAIVLTVTAVVTMPSSSLDLLSRLKDLPGDTQGALQQLWNVAQGTVTGGVSGIPNINAVRDPFGEAVRRGQNSGAPGPLAGLGVGIGTLRELGDIIGSLVQDTGSTDVAGFAEQVMIANSVLDDLGENAHITLDNLAQTFEDLAGEEEKAAGGATTLGDALRDAAEAAEEMAETEARLARARQGQAVQNMIQMQNAAIASGLALSAADIARLNDPGSFDFGTADNPVNPAAFGSGGPGGVVINATLQMSNGQEADLVVAGQELAATAGR